MKRKHIGHERTALGEIHIDIVADNRIVGQLDLCRKFLEALLIFGGSGRLRCSQVNAWNYIVFQIEIFFQQACLCLETFRSYYIVIGNRILYLKYRLRAHDAQCIETDGKYCDKD